MGILCSRLRSNIFIEFNSTLSEPIFTMKNSLMILAMAMMMCQLLVQVSSQDDAGGDDAAACTTIDHCDECPDPAVCTTCKCGYMKSAEDATNSLVEGATCVEDENADCSGAAAFGLTTILLLPVALASI